jgi:hypothetical protein
MIGRKPGVDGEDASFKVCDVLGFQKWLIYTFDVRRKLK